jgi:lipoprotein-anchoring transpeptidase ErfK/SrfK
MANMENDQIENTRPQPEIGENHLVDNSDSGSEIIGTEKPFLRRIIGNERLFQFLRAVFYVLLTLSTAVFLFFFFLFMVPGLKEMNSGHKTKITSDPELNKDAAYKKQITLMSKNIQQLSKKHNTYTSGLSYIVINTTDNRFFLYKNKKLIREGLCSSGANKILLTEKKNYIFKTPKGKFSITGKRKNPYWHRSDWDFIEQGLPVPPKDHPSRWEANVLGDYALDLVDGYMIHGTIYNYLMGMPVTHGCVRLGDKDLEVVYNTLNIGSKVYIF